MHQFKITEAEAGQRLDRFLSKYLNNTTRTNIFKLIRKKLIRINGKRAKEADMLQEGDVVEIKLHPNAVLEMIKEEDKVPVSKPLNVEIIYEDDEILVVNKPEGLLTHPDQNEYKRTLTTYVQDYLRPLWTPTFKPACVQRLDKNTSGIVIFGKTYTALKKYNALMRERKIQKFYQCIVHGEVAEAGEIKGYLAKNMDKNIVRLKLKEDDQHTKFVHTKYKPLARKKDYTLLEVELLTGRSHQIRASLAFIGHPIVGDTKYRGQKIKGITTQILHAWRVCVEHHEFICENPAIKEIWGKL